VPVGIILVAAARRDGRVPADDIGVMWAAVLAMYASLPALSWLIQGAWYDSTAAVRLFVLQPTENEVLSLQEIALAYGAGFTCAYLAFQRGTPAPVRHTKPSIPGGYMMAALAIFAIVQGISLVTLISGAIGGESYLDSYRVIQDLPLMLRQVIRVVTGISTIAQFVLLVGILERWPEQRALLFVFVALILTSFDADGSRFAVATGLVSVILAWHVLVRKLPVWFWVWCLVGGLGLFLILGLRRDLGSWSDVLSTGVPDFFSTGDFDSLWANAIELLQLRNAHGLDLPASVRFGELWAFIPSQFLPVEKLSLSDWYVETYYPYYQSLGGGWAFGAIAQAAVGGGIVEAALRGLGLGILAASLIKWSRRRASKWWVTPVYLYLLVFAFQSVRDTNLRLLADFVQLGIPGLLLIAGLGGLLSFARRRQLPVPRAW
jgi:hypothetical protein